MAKTKCPICKSPAEPMPGNKFFPFCGERCKLLDLSAWLNMDYRIPAQEEDEGDGPAGGETVH